MSMMMSLFCLLLLHNLYTAYELSCPASSHWTSRSEGLCTVRLASQYYCLWDTNNKSYTESCSEKPDVAPEGRKYIVEGSPTFVPCSLDRYQPITFYRNASSHCILRKSLCSERGQTLSDAGSTKDDVRCRCDYIQGYDYVTKPKDICYCNPTQEDCSCYLKQCKGNEYLSRDYHCLLKDAFPVKFQCKQIDSREENTTIHSKNIFTDSSIRTTTYGPTGGTVLIVTIVLLIGVTRIIYHMLTVRLNDLQVYKGISLERQIVGNWKTLKETINHELMLRSLVNEGMIQTDRMNYYKMKSPNSQKNQYLMCIIRKSRDQSSFNKCIGIFHMQGKSTMEVLNRLVINKHWRKRNLEKCRKQLAKCASSLHEFFNPDQVMDHFLENFIFDVNAFEDLLNCEDSTTMTQCFFEKVENSLHKGSFECLLKVLKDYKFDIVLEELETGLPPAISCKCEDGIIYSKCKVPKDNYEVNLTLSAANLKEEIKFEFWDSSCDCLVWLIKTFGVYPITSFVTGSATFHPLSDISLQQLVEGSQCGNWSHFLETVFNNIYIKNSEENGNVLIQMKISLKGDSKRDKLPGQNSSEDDSVNIFTANRKFLESHIDVNELIRAFSKEGHSIFQKCDGIPEIDQKAQKCIGLLEKNIHLKMQFIQILKKQREKNKILLDRLNTFEKVFNSNAGNLPNTIMYYFPNLVCLAEDFESFRNDFIERDILCRELTSIQEQHPENNRHKMIAFLIEILKSRRKNTMLSLVDYLFMYKHDSLAERLLQRKEHNVDVSDSTIITESVCINDELLFSGNFKVCFVD